MKFNSHNKVLIHSMNTEEAKAFVKFLQSEIHRHAQDIDQAKALVARGE